jgi:hypothetical protein
VAAAAQRRGCEVLVASLRPFGLPTDGPLPAYARDFAEAVRPFPDAAAAVAGDVTLPLLALDPGVVLTRAEVVRAARDHAASARWPAAARVLGQGPVDAAALVHGLLAPWTVDGSAVWAGNLTPSALVSVAEQERITARA